MGAKILTQERLKELLHYDSDTGVFTWRVDRGIKIAGSIAGTNCNGYRVIRVDGRAYGAHILAWIYIYGNKPTVGIDHCNKIKNDNSLANLRLATSSENQQNILSPRANNKLGVRGVALFKRTKKYHAQIAVKGKRIHLGYFDDLDSAIAARKQAEKQYHPFKVEA